MEAKLIIQFKFYNLYGDAYSMSVTSYLLRLVSFVCAKVPINHLAWIWSNQTLTAN
jgi:hypothetical protein